MPLSHQQRALAISWFQRHTNRSGEFRCLVCGSGGWELAADFVLMGPIDPGARNTDAGGGLPLVGFSCSGCGYTLFFNATRMGL